MFKNMARIFRKLVLKVKLLKGWAPFPDVYFCLGVRTNVAV